MAASSRNYHVSDSLDWYSFSGTSTVSVRTAKKRRTGHCIRDAAGGFLVVKFQCDQPGPRAIQISPT
jgi:hypothetical protein